MRCPRGQGAGGDGCNAFRGGIPRCSCVICVCAGWPRRATQTTASFAQFTTQTTQTANRDVPKTQTRLPWTRNNSPKAQTTQPEAATRAVEEPLPSHLASWSCTDPPQSHCGTGSVPHGMPVVHRSVAQATTNPILPASIGSTLRCLRSKSVPGIRTARCLRFASLTRTGMRCLRFILRKQRRCLRRRNTHPLPNADNTRQESARTRPQGSVPH